MDGRAFLQALLDHRKLTPNGVGERSGNHSLQSVVHRWLAGTHSRRPTMQPVADYFGVDVGAFYDSDKAIAELRRLGVDVGNGDISPVPAISLSDNPDYPAIRRVKFKLSAGASGFAVEYLDDDDAPIVFRRQWFESHGYKPEKLFAVRVANGSMETGLYHGDTVVVNTEQTEPKDGSVFAANYEGELVIKRLVRDAGQWWLSSDNADQRKYPRKVCDENVFLVGEIVHKQSERI